MSEAFMELAAEVERATAPDRRLDCRAWLLVGDQIGSPYSIRGSTPVRPRDIVQGRWFGSAFEKYPDDVDGVADNWRVPRFTASTDAARTMLVDVGYVLWRPVGKKPSVSTQIDGTWSDHSSGHCEAAAIAAAALRAWPSRPQWSHDRMPTGMETAR